MYQEHPEGNYCLYDLHAPFRVRLLKQFIKLLGLELRVEYRHGAWSSAEERRNAPWAGGGAKVTFHPADNVFAEAQPVVRVRNKVDREMSRVVRNLRVV